MSISDGHEITSIFGKSDATDLQGEKLPFNDEPIRQG